jgi:hypothetical protein
VHDASLPTAAAGDLHLRGNSLDPWVEPCPHRRITKSTRGADAPHRRKPARWWPTDSTKEQP